MKHVVMYSGGLASWAAAKRVAEQHGTDDLILLFADTLYEDEGLYQFLDESAANVGGTLVRLCYGKTPWGVFYEKRFLGNHRVDPCSATLKRKMLEEWRDTNLDPKDAVIYLGMTWEEGHRMKKVRKHTAPWNYHAPLMSRPLLSKYQIEEWAEQEGLPISRMYRAGFPHDNCGGRCIKGGKAHWLHLLKTFPERYRECEEEEEKFRQFIGKDVAILTDRRNKTRRPFTLRELREEYEQGAKQICMFDEDMEWGGCGCAIPDSD